MTEEPVYLVPVPSLVATLLNRERANGQPLSESDVIAIRDQCPCTAMTRKQLDAVTDRRGYDDIDPEHAWDEWQEIRVQFYDQNR